MVSKVRNVRLGVFSGGGCHHPNRPLQASGQGTDLFFFCVSATVLSVELQKKSKLYRAAIVIVLIPLKLYRAAIA